MARPSTYDPIYCDQIIEYFEEKASEDTRELAPTITEEIGYDSKGEKSSRKAEVRRICAELPTLQGFARSIGVSTKTLTKWAADYEEFGDAHARAKDIQQQLLVDRGLTRQYDSAAFVFVMQNISDWRARIDTKAENRFVDKDGKDRTFIGELDDLVDAATDKA